MWAIRRASIPTRSKTTLFAVARAFSTQSVIPNTNSKDIYETGPQLWAPNISPKIPTNRNSLIFYQNIRKFSTRPDGFSDMDLNPEPDDGVEDLSEAEPDSYNEIYKSEAKESDSSLAKILIDAPLPSIAKSLNKWVENGILLVKDDVDEALHQLKTRKLYKKAFQFMQWLESNKPIKFDESDYICYVDLIAKVQGIEKAEKYIDRIPKPFKTSSIYETLLANCANLGYIKKSEEIFKKIKPVTLPACNQLLLLYKRNSHTHNKISDVIKIMEKEKITPSLFTYQILIDIKGRCNDIEGMEQIVERMKSDSVGLDFVTLAVVVRHYISNGQTEKAEATLKEIERANTEENSRGAFKTLLPLYATLGKSDDVGRLWEMCKASNPTFEEYLAAIDAWGKLGEIEQAESEFETMLKSSRKLPATYYNALLNVYADHKLLNKGKELVKRMYDDGCQIGPNTWDPLVKLYVYSGDVAKADSVLHKVMQQNQMKPLYQSFITVMDYYAKMGDVHNSEKMFHKVKENHKGKAPPYQLLLEAYVNAKATPYGFRDRMKADNFVPNKQILAQLEVMDAFSKKKSDISDLVD